jgi:hypothetical protein
VVVIVGVDEGVEEGAEVVVCVGVDVTGGLLVVVVVVSLLPQLMKTTPRTKISVRASKISFFTVLSFLPFYIIRLP